MRSLEEIKARNARASTAWGLPSSDGPDFEACLALDVEHLVGLRWRAGGRDFEPGGETDCLGISLHVVRDVLGIPAADPWDEHEQRCTLGEMFVSGWEKIEDGPRHRGDVALTNRGFHVAVYVGAGWWLSAKEHVGTYRVSDRELTPEILAIMRWTGGRS